MHSQHINIQINLDGLRTHLSRSLQKNILLVAGGLQNLQQLDPKFLELPTAFKMNLATSLKWEKAEAVATCSEWILSNGFRDEIESVSSFLEEAHRVLSIWELTEEHAGQDGQLKLSGQEWNEAMISGPQRFHRRGLPDKLDHLRGNHDIGLDERLCAHVLSINKARNCLVHRGGIVSDRDANTGNDTLEVTWRRLDYFLRDEDGEKPLQIGQVVEKESTLCVRAEDTAKTFPLGSRITFSVQEFSDSCWCLFLFGENLIQTMNTHGLEKGFLE